MAKAKKLYRSGKNKILGGICGGLGDYFDTDPTLIRLLWIFFGLAVGTGVLAYLIAWLVIPRNPKHKW